MLKSVVSISLLFFICDSSLCSNQFDDTDVTFKKRAKVWATKWLGKIGCITDQTSYFNPETLETLLTTKERAALEKERADERKANLLIESLSYKPNENA